MKINYIRRWGDNGTCYRQTIKLNKEESKILNEAIKQELKEIENLRQYTSRQMTKKTYMKELKQGLNYITLITVELMLSLFGYNEKRLKYRNTIVICEEV